MFFIGKLCQVAKMYRTVRFSIRKQFLSVARWSKPQGRLLIDRTQVPRPGAGSAGV